MPEGKCTFLARVKAVDGPALRSSEWVLAGDSDPFFETKRVTRTRPDDVKPKRTPPAWMISLDPPLPVGNRVLSVGHRPCDIMRHLATMLKTNVVAPLLREYAED